jgi:hypothetical protein
MLRPSMLHIAHTYVVIPETISITACFNSGVVALIINKKHCLKVNLKLRL